MQEKKKEVEYLTESILSLQVQIEVVKEECIQANANVKCSNYKLTYFIIVLILYIFPALLKYVCYPITKLLLQK